MIRLLFIAHRVPYPPNKGERLRALEQIKALAGHFRVTVASFAHDRRDYESADALRQWDDARRRLFTEGTVRRRGSFLC